MPTSVAEQMEAAVQAGAKAGTRTAGGDCTVGSPGVGTCDLSGLTSSSGTDGSGSGVGGIGTSTSTSGDAPACHNGSGMSSGLASFRSFVCSPGFGSEGGAESSLGGRLSAGSGDGMASPGIGSRGAAGPELGGRLGSPIGAGLHGGSCSRSTSSSATGVFNHISYPTCSSNGSASATGVASPNTSPGFRNVGSGHCTLHVASHASSPTCSASMSASGTGVPPQTPRMAPGMGEAATAPCVVRGLAHRPFQMMFIAT